jgi:hypothetical protein
VVVAATAERRSRGGDEAGDDGEGERRVEAVAEWGGDQFGEEGRAGEGRVRVRGQCRQGFGPDQVLDRVVAEEGGEEDRDRRHLGGVVGRAGGDAVRL